jgi:hypothetical protein
MVRASFLGIDDRACALVTAVAGKSDALHGGSQVPRNTRFLRASSQRKRRANRGAAERASRGSTEPRAGIIPMSWSVQHELAKKRRSASECRSRTQVPMLREDGRGQNAYAQTGANARSSQNPTRSPSELRNAAPIGATGMGRQGAKYRWGEKGQMNATPSPPSVSASSRPWLPTTRATTTDVRTGFEMRENRPARATATANIKANASECVVAGATSRDRHRERASRLRFLTRATSADNAERDSFTARV